MKAATSAELFDALPDKASISMSHALLTTPFDNIISISPIIEFATCTLKPGGDIEELKAAIDSIARELKPVSHGSSWGPSVDESHKIIGLVGWDSVEVSL